MSDDDEHASILDSDAVELEVTDDPKNESRTIVTGATVSGSEKVSTGKYENIEPHQSITVEFRPAFDVTNMEGLERLRHQIKGLHAEVQRHLSDAIERRTSEPRMSDDVFQQADDQGGDSDG